MQNKKTLDCGQIRKMAQLSTTQELQLQIIEGSCFDYKSFSNCSVECPFMYQGCIFSLLAKSRLVFISYESAFHLLKGWRVDQEIKLQVSLPQSSTVHFLTNTPCFFPDSIGSYGSCIMGVYMQRMPFWGLLNHLYICSLVN